jgi:hypothetical protein
MISKFSGTPDENAKGTFDAFWSRCGWFGYCPLLLHGVTNLGMKSELAPIVLLLLLATFIVGIGLSLYSTMTPARFTVRNLLISTGWFCVWSALIFNYQEIVNTSPVSMVSAWIALVVVPFAGAGSIVGKSKEGIMLGFSVVVVLIVFGAISSVLVLLSSAT